MSARKTPTRQTSGGSSSRNGPRRTTSESATFTPPPPSFSAKEVFEFLASRVAAAGEQAVVYKGEQKAWGGARQFNPVNDDFLHIVQMALDEFNSKKTIIAAAS